MPISVRSWPPILVALLLAVALLAPDAHAQAPGVFVYGQSGDPQTLDPALIEDGLSAHITSQIFETLVELDGAPMRIRPALAESWDSSPDGRVWTFQLRQAVTFHDGTPFDAAAVKTNFDRWQSQDGDPTHSAVDFLYWNDITGLGKLVESTAAVDTYQFQVRLKDASAPFLKDLALAPFAIVSPTALATNADNLSLNPVGTGPFRFVEWAPGDHVTLVSNDRYWGDRPGIDQVIVRTVTDNAVRFAELRAGNLDVMEVPNPDDVRAARNNPDIEVLQRPSLNVAYVDFNQFVSPFGDARVRNALALATNRKKLVETLYGDSGMAAKEILPPGLPGYDDTVSDIPYDPVRAKQLLAEAGLPNGFATDFWYLPVGQPYAPNPQSVATAICADWARVGVRCTLKTEDWAAYRADARSHKLPVWLLGRTVENGDPDSLLFPVFGVSAGRDRPGYNTWDQPAVRDLLLRAQRSIDDEERARLYRQVAATVRADMPKIPLAHTTSPVLARAWVQGYAPSPASIDSFRSVLLNREHSPADASAAIQHAASRKTPTE